MFDKKGRRSDAARAKGRVTLTRTDIIRAGAQLLDSEGLEGISMRKLASVLDTGPATLYWHVRDKDELLALILDETLQTVEMPSEGDWAERLIAVVCATRQALLPRPALVRVIWDAGWDIGPQTLRIAEAMISLVAESGLPAEQVADAYFAVLTFLLGFVLAETAGVGTPRFGTHPLTGPTDANNRATMVEQFPALARFGPATDPEGMERRFRYGLNLLVEGIRTHAHRQIK